MLKETPLVNVHRNHGGKLVDFGGWNMPLHYGSQLEEHHYVRKSAGMFDVSHMTVVDVSGDDAKEYLQILLANDVNKLHLPGKALYSAMLNEKAGVIDDLIVYLMNEGYRLVVNCSTGEKVLAWMNAQIKGKSVYIKERPELAMIAVQGPEARAIVDTILKAPELEQLQVFQGTPLKGEYFVARTGYTGESGYEIILPATEAEAFWLTLQKAGVHPCGLGARDTLRLEAGMNLYGHEMDEETSPLKANMAWTISWQGEERRFIGREVLEREKQEGLKEKLVGLVLLDKGVMRAGQKVFLGEDKATGIITSGSFSPTLGKSIALARVPVQVAEACQVEIRHKRLNAKVVKPGFVRMGKSLLE